MITTCYTPNFQLPAYQFCGTLKGLLDIDEKEDRGYLDG